PRRRARRRSRRRPRHGGGGRRRCPRARGLPRPADAVIRPVALVLVASLALVAAGCGGGDNSNPTLLVAINAPFSKTPYVGETIARGAELAVHDINARGGVQVGGKNYDLRTRRLDNAL